MSPIGNKRSVLKKTNTVPHVPIELRREKYEQAVDRYISGNIDEDELESEIEDALYGRIRFSKLVESINTTIRAGDLPPERQYVFFGTEIAPGESVELEKTPSLEDTLEIVE